MLFGSCYLIGESKENIDPKSIKIYGVQRSLLVNFEVEQTFMHFHKEAKEISFIFPNNFKICIYDTTFVVGEEVIKPKLQSKEEAEKTYKEAVRSGHTSFFGTNNNNINGITDFKIGNIPPNVECKVILKIAFTGQIANEKAFYIKLPIDHYFYDPFQDPFENFIKKSDFSIQLQIDSEIVSKVTSNVKDTKYDEETKVFSINNTRFINSVIIRFETKEEIKSSCLLSSTENYDNYAIIISPNLPPIESSIREFIFVVDCSGSMGGKSIKKASECLEFFIRSLPSNSYFNIIRFGSEYEKLFDKSVLYNDTNVEKAINLALNLEADLGMTNIYSPLNDIFSQKNNLDGQHQIFIITDGEVEDVEKVLNLVALNAKENRCFTIGIGNGCDFGLVEGIAMNSGGKSDFVQEGDSISDRLIPQLQSSLQPMVHSLEIHFEGEDNDSFEISPYPLPSVNPKGSCVIFARKKKRNNEMFENGFLITGIYGNESIEIPVNEIHQLDENKFGCSDDKNVGNVILPLFAFSLLKNFEIQLENKKISDEIKAKAIEVSLASGVLCRYTGYVGLSEKPNDPLEALSQKRNTSNDPFSAASRNESVSNDPFEALSQKRNTSNDPFSAASRDKGDDPFAAASRNKGDDPFAAPSRDKGDDPFAAPSRNKGDDPFAAPSRNKGDDPFAAPSRNKGDDPFAAASRNKGDDPFAAPSRDKGDDPFAAPSRNESVSNDPLEALSQKRNTSNDPFSAASRDKGDDPFAAPSRNESVSNDPFEALSQKRNTSNDPFSAASRDKGDDPFAAPSRNESVSNDPLEAPPQKQADSISIERLSIKKIMKMDVPTKYDLISLTRYQKACGYWDDINAVKSITGIKIDQIDEISLPDKNIEKKCIATILAIAAMRVKSSDEKNSWVMIEQKALLWLKQALPGVIIEPIISKIESSIY